MLHVHSDKFENNFKAYLEEKENGFIKTSWTIAIKVNTTKILCETTLINMKEQIILFPFKLFSTIMYFFYIVKVDKNVFRPNIHFCLTYR